MYCPSCGTSLSEEALFCLKCGTLTPRGSGVSGESRPAPIFTPASSPSDPYSSPRPSTSYGPLPFEAETQSTYASSSPYSPLPPPPPRRRRIFPGILFVILLVILLLGGGVGGVLFLKQRSPSTLVSHTKPTPIFQPTVHSATTTPQPTVHSATTTPQPTVHSVTPTPNTTFPSLPGTWTQCAAETATCTFSGTMTIAFGANGSYNYATKTNGVACTTGVFGDPLSGTQKACYREVAPSTTKVWAKCAVENSSCTFLGTMTVAFGVNGSYKYATKSNGVNCTVGVFGDPLYGTGKACYLLSPPTSAAAWKSCAAENGTCTFTGRREVAYGVNGQFFYGSFTNGTVCSNGIFGDPASGVAKTCYYQ